MSNVVTTWVVLDSYDVTADDLDGAGRVRDDVVTGWLEVVRDEYLDCCVVLREKCAATGCALRTELDAVPARAQFERVTAVTVSAGATEFWPDAFSLAIRVRGLGASDDMVCNLSYRVSLRDSRTGESCELGDDVRDELIALAHAARHYN